jgi:hypothetical protein
MRPVKISVGSTPVGEQKTWAYPAGQRLGLFMTPIYECFVEGKNSVGAAVREKFNVLRFGVQSKDGRTASVVGLAEQQTHVIKAWLPHYVVHSAASPENGAWQVYDSFLIHDGPDNPGEIFATIGCVEVMGVRGFVRFNDLVIALSGPKATARPQQLAETGSGGQISITYTKATRPPLKRAP